MSLDTFYPHRNGRAPGRWHRHGPVQATITRRPVRVPEDFLGHDDTNNKGYGPRYDDGHPKLSQYDDSCDFDNFSYSAISITDQGGEG